jgi:hypothetical protein
MTEVFSPFAPLWTWLALGDHYVRASNGLMILRALEIDLRDIQTRAIVLHALAQHGHRFPWALGSIWSTLTDEQAGRLTAEIVRRIGPDPSAPTGVIPVVVLGPWQDGKRCSQRRPIVPFDSGIDQIYVIEVNSRGWLRYFDHGGPETDVAGKRAAEHWAARGGSILIEQLTPEAT